jgi:hypothetical protein
MTPLRRDSDGALEKSARVSFQGNEIRCHIGFSSPVSRRLAPEQCEIAEFKKLLKKFHADFRGNYRSAHYSNQVLHHGPHPPDSRTRIRGARHATLWTQLSYYPSRAKNARTVIPLAGGLGNPRLRSRFRRGLTRPTSAMETEEIRSANSADKFKTDS